MAEVYLTPRAQTDLHAIWSFLAADNMRAADSLIARFAERFDLAADFPEMGMLQPDLGSEVRSLVIGQYEILYQPMPTGIAVIRVVHGRSNPENWL